MYPNHKIHKLFLQKLLIRPYVILFHKRKDLIDLEITFLYKWFKSKPYKPTLLFRSCIENCTTYISKMQHTNSKFCACTTIELMHIFLSCKIFFLTNHIVNLSHNLASFWIKLLSLQMKHESLLIGQACWCP